MRRPLLVIAAFGFTLAPLVSACASAAAKAPAEVPALNVPPPPPRVIEPVAIPEPPPEPVADLPPAPTPSRPSRPAPREKEAAKPAAETKPPETPPAETPVTPPPVQPPAQLRTPETADTSEATRTVRATIDRTRAALGSVNFALLSNERKKAYNDAKMFADQAENALQKSNLAFAQGVANKAETLAKTLAGR